MSADHHCAHTYDGPERRVIPDRRQECPLHETIDRELQEVKHEIVGKVPMRLFFATAGGLIVIVLSILGFQWTTYERVNSIGLSHAQAMGEIKVELQKVSSSIDADRLINRIRDDQLTSTVKTHVDSTDRVVREIKQSIKEMEKTMKEESK